MFISSHERKNVIKKMITDNTSLDIFIQSIDKTSCHLFDLMSPKRKTRVICNLSKSKTDSKVISEILKIDDHASIKHKFDHNEDIVISSDQLIMKKKDAVSIGLLDDDGIDLDTTFFLSRDKKSIKKVKDWFNDKFENAYDILDDDIDYLKKNKVENSSNTCTDCNSMSFLLKKCLLDIQNDKNYYILLWKDERNFASRQADLDYRKERGNEWGLLDDVINWPSNASIVAFDLTKSFPSFDGVWYMPKDRRPVKKDGYTRIPRKSDTSYGLLQKDQLDETFKKDDDFKKRIKRIWLNSHPTKGYLLIKLSDFISLHLPSICVVSCEGQRVDEIYESLKDGIFRYGWSYVKKEGVPIGSADLRSIKREIDTHGWDSITPTDRERYHPFLLDIKSGDWVIFNAVPSQNSFTSARISGDYYWDKNERKNYNHCIPIDTNSLFVFEKNDDNLTPETLKLIKIKERNKFIPATKNLMSFLK